MAPPTANEPASWLRALFYDSPMAIGFSRDGTILDANAAYLATFGYEHVDQVRGRSLLELVTPSHRPDVLAKIARRAKGEPVETTYRSRGLRPDGTEFPVEVTTCRVALADGPLTIAFFRDVSDSERAQAELSAALERFRMLSAAALEGVYVHEDGKIIQVNEAGAALVGARPEELIGRSVLELCAPESRERAQASIRGAGTEPFEITAQRLDGSRVPFEIRSRLLSHQGRPTRIALIRDLSEQKRAETERAALEERVRRSEKLESLGTLAAGVAHDFNNILSIIVTEAVIARRSEGEKAACDEHLLAIEQAAERAAELCRQMLTYSGRARHAPQSIELCELVSDMAAMLDSAVARRASLRLELARGLKPVLGDATQLRQVLLNLVLNACEASSSPSAEVRISTGATHLESALPGRAASGSALEAGDYTWLEVSDNGHGMDAATAAKIFDPFFTTKFMGRGLGMASVLGIVRGHHGAIDVESEPGRGTRIRVLLPVANAQVGEPRAPAAAPAEEARGAGLVLVVEDEPALRRATEVLLRSVGFEVIDAADGAAGVEAFEAHADRVRAVLMDVAMPGMDGIAASATIRRQAPRVPILLLTGHPVALADTLASSGANELLQKPYAPSQLLAVLRRITA